MIDLKAIGVDKRDDRPKWEDWETFQELMGRWGKPRTNLRRLLEGAVAGGRLEKKHFNVCGHEVACYREPTK